MTFLLFDYAVSAMKNTVHGFRPRFAVWQEPDLYQYINIYNNINLLHSFSVLPNHTYYTNSIFM